ncbi:MAG: hypothetical protein ACT4NL_02855 [Pseudomarimonas sp.]
MKKALSVLLLGLLCALPFFPGLNGPFMLDDVGNLSRARATSGSLLDFADAVIRNGSGLLHRPVSNLSFLINYHWIGNAPFHYKVVNLLIHIGNGALLFLLLGRLIPIVATRLASEESRKLAAYVSLVWLVHPLHISTVLYPVQRMTQLSATFLFITLWYSLGALDKLQAPDTPTRKGYLLAFTALSLMLLSVLSKESGALIPLMLLSVLIFAPSSRWKTWAASRPSRVFLSLTVALPLALGTVGAALLLPSFIDDYRVREFSMMERLLTQPAVLCHYLQTILWPDIRSMGLYLDIFQTRKTNDVFAWLGLLATLSTVALAFVLRKRTPVAAFALLWFFAAHAMESSFIALEMAFEHRNHVAMLGPILWLVYCANMIASRAFTKRQLTLLAVIPLLVLAGLTAQRAHQWSNSNLFTETEVRNQPLSTRANSQMASLLGAQGKMTEALTFVRKAQALKPNQFWQRSYDLHLSCWGAATSYDLDLLVSLAHAHPDAFGIDEALKPVVILIGAKRCPSLTSSQMDHFLTRLLAAVKSTKRLETIENLHILRSMLAEAHSDTEATKLHLSAAASANERGLTALGLLAYHELNYGSIERARELADRLEQRIRKYHRITRLHEVDELRLQIEDASATQTD